MKSSNELAELAESFEDLTPEKVMEGLDSVRADDMGTRFDHGQLKGIPYNEAQVRDLCDRCQWVAENSDYRIKAMWEADEFGFQGRCAILDKDGQEIPTNIPFEPLDRQVPETNFTPKRVYRVGTLMVDNTIRWMIEKGLTNGGEK